MTSKKIYSSKSQQTNEDPKQLFPQRIYPELNLEKWSIWQPTNSRTKPKAKILERQIQLPGSSQVMAKVKVGFTDLGVLTTEDQKVYYALIKMWEEDGRPEILYLRE